MNPYRAAPHPALEPPPPDAAWYEQLAHAIVLAHQPSEAVAGRRVRATAPPPDIVKVVELAAKHLRPRCLRCTKDVDAVFVRRRAMDVEILVMAECHGERYAFMVSERVLEVAATAGRDHLARILQRELARPVFDPPPPAPPPPEGHECFGYCPLCDPRAHLAERGDTED